MAGTELGRSVGSCLGCVLIPKPMVSADFLGGGAVTRLGGSTSCCVSS
jgi:hypothetical protein